MFIIQLPSARKLLLNPQIPPLGKTAFLFACIYISLCELHSVSPYTAALKVNSLIIKPCVPLTIESEIKWEGSVVLIRPEPHRPSSVKCFLMCSCPRLAGIPRLAQIAHAKALSDNPCEPETSKRGDYIRRQWVSF